MSAPWLPPYLTESLHMLHTYNTWGGNVSRTIFRTKSQRSTSYVSFQVLALSAPWVYPYLTECLHICGICNNTWGGGVMRTIFRTKGQRSRWHWSFEVFVVSVTWLPPFCNLSISIWFFLWRLRVAATIKSPDCSATKYILLNSRCILK